MKTLDYVLLGIFGVVVLYFMIGALSDLSAPSIALEAKNMTANNTAVLLAHPTAVSYGRTLWFNSTHAVPAANYLYTATNVKIYTNGTGGYPNITNASAGVLYYASYTYQVPVTIWGLDFTFIALLVFLAVVIGIAMKLTWKGK